MTNKEHTCLYILHTEMDQRASHPVKRQMNIRLTHFLLKHNIMYIDSRKKK